DVKVTNTGNVILTGLTVADPLTGGALASGVTLAVGGVVDYFPSYTLTQADVDQNGNPGGTGNITNTATAKDDQGDSGQSTVSTPVDYAPGLSIVKTVISVDDTNGDGLTDAGDVIHYDVLVKNTGDVSLTGVNVTDPLTGAALASGVPLAVGGSLDFTPSYTLTQ